MHFWLHYTAHCVLACRFCVSRKGGTGGGGWGHPLGGVHMVAARLIKRDWVGSEWANSCPGCMKRLRKLYSHIVWGSFLAEKVAWALRWLSTDNTNYCMLVHEWACLRSCVYIFLAESAPWFWSQGSDRNEDIVC